MNLPSADDLFTTQEEREQKNQEYVKNISIYEITDFPNHPFKVKMDDKMLETIESVRDHGVLVPALVREKPTGGYEMISGHRRKMASELAGKETMPCIVRNLSDDEAVVVMVDSNLQREEILPSEKAFAYKMKLDAMKRQGNRTDLTSTPLARKLKGKESAEILGEQVGESKDQIRRYIRLSRYQYKENYTNTTLSVKKLNRFTKKIKDKLSELEKNNAITISETVDIINDELMGAELKKKVVRNGLKLLQLICGKACAGSSID